MRNNLILLFFLIYLTVNATDITGIIVDTDNQPLPGATLTLSEMPDSIKTGIESADIDGNFLFKSVNSGKYLLTATMVGMDNVEKSFTIHDSISLFNAGKFIMTENAVTLSETIVTAVKSAIIAKQDTLEYNADSFHTQSNATVNDLLKKLPGVEVGQDGAITSNGKTVTKILVDGKEFFSDDPQMASKNLPSNMVDKVQVIDRKSDFSRLTGVDDGEEETVINLTVKKNMANSVFGNIGGGYGTDNRYQGNFIINNFYNGNQITFLGGINNINENGFTDRGRGRFRDFGGSGGITTAQRLGLNFNVGKDEDFRIGGNILYSHSSRFSTKKSETQYLFPDSVSYQSSGSESHDRGHNLNADLRLQWKIDASNTLDFRPRFSLNFRDGESADSSILRAGDPMLSLVNSNRNAKNNHGNNIETSGNLIFNHNFLSNPGRSMSMNVQYSFSKNLQKGVTWSDIEYYLLKEEDELLYRYLDNDSRSNSLEGRITWTEPFADRTKGYFLTFSYNIKYQWNNADQITYNLPTPEITDNFYPPQITNVPFGAEEDFDLSNRFRNNYFNQELRFGFKKISKTLNLETGILFSPSSSQSINLINSNKNIPKRWVWNIAPFANLRYKFGDRSSLRASYRARTTQPTMGQLQPVADVSNPLSIVIGNPELKPTFTQNISFHLNDYRSSTQQSFSMMLNASFAINSIVSNTVSDAETGGRITTYSNINGNFSLTGMAMLSRPFTNKKWRFNVRLNSRYQTAPGYINGDYNRTENLSLSPSAGLTFSSDIFQMSLNPTYSLSSTTNSLLRQTDRKTHSYGFNTDASLYFPFGLDITTDFSFTANTGYSRGYNINQSLWNAQLAYSLLNDKSLVIALKAYDILGQKKNISRTISASAITDSSFNELTRYFMLSLTWNFNSLKNKSNPNDGFNDFPPDLPPSSRDYRQGVPEEGNRQRSPEMRGGMQGPPPGR